MLLLLCRPCKYNETNWYQEHANLQEQHAALRIRLVRSCPARVILLHPCVRRIKERRADENVPQEFLYGADLFPEYEALGHELFRDADKFQDRFITADLFHDSKEGGLTITKGTWNVVSIVMFLHIWDWDTQVAACKRILGLLKREKGSMIIGAQTGSTQPGHLELKPPYVAQGEERRIFRHNLETFAQMWDQIKDQEGVELKMQVEYDSQQARDILVKEHESGERGFFFQPSDAERKLFFSVELL